MNMTEIFALVAIALVGIAAEITERKSRKWYYDRVLLRLSGFAFGCAVTLLCYLAAR